MWVSHNAAIKPLENERSTQIAFQQSEQRDSHSGEYQPTQECGMGIVNNP